MAASVAGDRKVSKKPATNMEKTQTTKKTQTKTQTTKKTKAAKKHPAA